MTTNTRRSWTAADDERIRAGKAKGETNVAIATDLECTPRAVRSHWSTLLKEDRKRQSPATPPRIGGHREGRLADQALVALRARLYPHDPERAERIAARRSQWDTRAQAAHRAAITAPCYAVPPPFRSARTWCD